MESLNPPNKTVPPLTLIRAIIEVENKGDRTKITEAKTLNMMTKTLDGMDSNA